MAAGLNSFVFEVPPPNIDKIPKDEWIGLSVILLECTYRETIFIRIGYYVDNVYTGGELEEAPESISRRLEQQKLFDEGEETTSEDEDEEEDTEDGELSTDDLIEDEVENNEKVEIPVADSKVSDNPAVISLDQSPCVDANDERCKEDVETASATVKKRSREESKPNIESCDSNSNNEICDDNHLLPISKKIKCAESLASSNDGGDEAEAEVDFMIPLRETAPRWFSNVDPNLITRNIILESHRITLFNIRWDDLLPKTIVDRSGYDYDF